MFAGKRYWIVGASEGLGRELARQMSANGAHLVVSGRNADRLTSLAGTLPNCTPEALDIQNATEVAKVAQRIGPLDGLVFAAGVYWPMKAGAWNPEQIETMCDVNFTGAARVLSRVVPDMVRRDDGHVVIIGSLSGFRGLPGAFGYAASKAGLMHLAECLHADLHRSNVRVQLINPGFIRTRLTDKNDFSMPFLLEADQAAERVIIGMQSRRFQTNFPRIFSWLFRGGNFLPAGVYYRVFGAGRPVKVED